MLLALPRIQRISVASCCYAHSTLYIHVRCASTTTTSNDTSTLAVLSSIKHLPLDRGQRRAARYLDRLQQALTNYSNVAIWNQRIEEIKRRKQQEEEERERATAVLPATQQQPTLASVPLTPESLPAAGTKTTVQSPITMVEQTQLRTTPCPPTEHSNHQQHTSTSQNASSRTNTTATTTRIPRGLYIYGPVGTGKTMLMHAFYDSLNDNPLQKEKWHFHAFMNHIHEQIHAMKKQQQQQANEEEEEDEKNMSLLLTELFGNKPLGKQSTTINPVHHVALQLSKRASVLCLDEFQVTDIADAAMLSQLFRVLFTMGTVLVATSNRPPHDLYQGGLHREFVFTPLLELLQRYCIVHSIQSETDYRLIAADNNNNYTTVDTDHDDITNHSSSTSLSTFVQENSSFYFCPQNDYNTAGERPQWEQVLQWILPDDETDAKFQPTTLTVGYNRTWTIQNTIPNLVAVFDFETICQREMIGATEYRALAQSQSDTVASTTNTTIAPPLFPIIVITGIPRIDNLQQQHNQARRFITLIDELYYNGRTALLCTAQAPAQELFPISTTTTRQDSNWKSGNNNQNGNDQDILAIDQAVSSDGQTAVGALASVTELSFAFQRCSSRLVEMTSWQWWNQCGALQHINKKEKERL